MEYKINDTQLNELKIILREKDIPFFDDSELNFYFAKNKGNFNNTVYECLLVKSENTTLNISGLSTADMSNYFRRLAKNYRPNNSGVLKS